MATSSPRFEFEIKDKGRVVLPGGLRDICGFSVGTRLVARPLGKGQAIIETTDAVLERIWAGVPEQHAGSAVEALKQMRTGDAALQHETLNKRQNMADTAQTEKSERRSSLLLTELGLD